MEKTDQRGFLVGLFVEVEGSGVIFFRLIFNIDTSPSVLECGNRV